MMWWFMKAKDACCIFSLSKGELLVNEGEEGCLKYGSESVVLKLVEVMLRRSCWALSHSGYLLRLSRISLKFLINYHGVQRRYCRLNPAFSAEERSFKPKSRHAWPGAAALKAEQRKPLMLMLKPMVQSTGHIRNLCTMASSEVGQSRERYGRVV